MTSNKQHVCANNKSLLKYHPFTPSPSQPVVLMSGIMGEQLIVIIIRIRITVLQHPPTPAPLMDNPYPLSKLVSKSICSIRIK